MAKMTTKIKENIGFKRKIEEQWGLDLSYSLKLKYGVTLKDLGHMNI